MSKVGIPQGTRDFSPIQVAKRSYIFETIKNTFLKYGFQPIETPTMENLSTLTGKYGEEGDKLLFKILNNGEFLNKVDKTLIDDANYNKLVPALCDRGMRYDLTVPFARYVVMHLNDIQFPFKRYQIQPVWRADRPQKGRYREFYQCDADVVGSNSIMYESELIQIYDQVFQKFGLNVTIKLNNRKILSAIATVAGIPNQMMDMTISIDKLDKIGLEGVKNELLNRAISVQAIDIIIDCLQINDLGILKTKLENSEEGMLGISELEKAISMSGITHNKVEFDITLARGLNYYTGCILEVKANDVEMGSIGGGGRYDDLTSVFGLKDVSGVGISFGADRIYDCLEQLDLFPNNNINQTKAIILSFDYVSFNKALELSQKLRSEGFNIEVYPEGAKFPKQMKYTNDRNIPFAIIIGENELTNSEFTLKDMDSGNQESLDISQLIAKLK
jgi:histidyl-tRNA synthetase